MHNATPRSHSRPTRKRHVEVTQRALLGRPVGLYSSHAFQTHLSGVVSGDWVGTAAQSLQAVVLGSRLNVLLFGIFFIPSLKGSDAACFTTSLICLIPLAERIGFVTEHLCRHTSDAVGGLINATFGNATEVLVSLYALQGGLYRVVQLALLGSILSNLLLVLGLSCFVGGLRWKVQTFKVVSGAVPSSLLLLSVMGLLLPAALKMSGQEDDRDDELNFSRFVAVILLMMYVAFLIFQLRTHAEEYEENGQQGSALASPSGVMSSEDDDFLDAQRCDSSAIPGFAHHRGVVVAASDASPRPGSTRGAGGGASRRSNTVAPAASGEALSTRLRSNSSVFGEGAPPAASPRGAPDVISSDADSGDIETASVAPSARSDAPSPVGKRGGGVEVGGGGGGGVPQEKPARYALGKWESILWLCIITKLVSFVGETMVGSIEGFTQEVRINSVFVSAVIIPVMGNAAEHSAAVMFAYKNRMDISLGIALGSCTQIAMCVLPFCVISGYFLDRNLSLFFHGFETAALMASVVIVTAILHGGTTNWLVGFLLLGSYLIVSCGFWVHELENLSVSKGLPEGAHMKRIPKLPKA